MIYLLLVAVACLTQVNGQCTPRNALLSNPIADKDTGLFEGDIRFTSSQLKYMQQYNVLPITSNRRWGTVGATVPYTMASSYSSSQKSLIRSSLAKLSALTGYCVRFVERTTERDYISVFKSSGCWSYIGRTGGMQQLSLANGCLQTGIIQHEFLHALGFWHEQSRADRDSYVTVMWNNINSRFCNNFWKTSWSQSTSYGQPYDYGSVMHYGPNGFSRNGEPTLVPRQSVTIGQRSGASSIDVAKLMSLYQCS